MEKMCFRRIDFVLTTLLLCVGVAGCKPDSDGVSKETAEEAVKESITNRVLVIENLESPTSTQITNYYMEKRGVQKRLQVRCPDSALNSGNETIPFPLFQEAIEAPLKAYLLKDPSIDFIVLTKGVPIRLAEAPIGFSNNQPSLDSYLAASGYFDNPSTKHVVIDEGGWKGKCFVNNYFNATERFSHSKFGGYLVTRLDGYTVEAAMTLVDSSLASSDE